MTDHQEKEIEKVLINNPDLVEELSKYTVDGLQRLFKGFKMLELLEKQCIPCDEDINYIGLIANAKPENGLYWAVMNGFLYGKMQGVRAERARRKKVGVA